MRFALQMFTTFLASGTTDVDKMLRIYRRERWLSRCVSRIREIDKCWEIANFTKESHSTILNVFDCGLEKNSSHFTASDFSSFSSNVPGNQQLRAKAILRFRPLSLYLKTCLTIAKIWFDV